MLSCVLAFFAEACQKFPSPLMLLFERGASTSPLGLISPNLTWFSRLTHANFSSKGYDPVSRRLSVAACANQDPLQATTGNSSS